MNPEEEAFAQGFIRRSRWVFAKTYAETFPHEYAVRGRDPAVSSEEFTEFVRLIRLCGYQARFNGRLYTYIELTDPETGLVWKYWAMSGPEASKLVNRDRVDGWPHLNSRPDNSDNSDTPTRAPARTIKDDGLSS